MTETQKPRTIGIKLSDKESGEEFTVIFAEDGTHIGTNSEFNLNSMGEVLKVVNAFEDIVRILSEAKLESSGEPFTDEDKKAILEMLIEFRKRNSVVNS